MTVRTRKPYTCLDLTVDNIFLRIACGTKERFEFRGLVCSNLARKGTKAMQRRPEEAPAPLTRTLAQIDAEQAILTAERERAEKAQRAEERRRRAEQGATVLVGASPSPSTSL